MRLIDTWPNDWAALPCATDRHARFRPFSKNRSTDEVTDPSVLRSSVHCQKGISPCIRELCSALTGKTAWASFSLPPFNSQWRRWRPRRPALDAHFEQLQHSKPAAQRCRVGRHGFAAHHFVDRGLFTFSLGHAWASLLIAIPANGFLVRLFLIQPTAVMATFSPAVWRMTRSAASLACSRSRPTTVGVVCMRRIMPPPGTSIGAVSAISIR